MNKYTMGLIALFLLLITLVAYANTPTQQERSQKIRHENRERIEELKSTITPLEKEIELLEEENKKRRELECTLNPECKKDSTVSRDKVLMDRVCKQQSPMCNDWDMFNTAKKIFEDRGVPFGIALGIMSAESTLGKNYAKGCDSSYNNWGGIKWRKNDDGSVTKDQPIPDANGCWMYRFDSMEDYFKSKANTLGIGYKACFSREQPIRCISYAYVGDPNVAEQSWINNVSYIAY